MGILLGLFGGVAVLAVIVIAREVGLVPERLAVKYQQAALVTLLVIVPVVGGLLGFLEGRAKLD